MIVDGTWSIAEARAYMDVFCLKNSTQGNWRLRGNTMGFPELLYCGVVSLFIFIDCDMPLTSPGSRKNRLQK